MGIRTSWSPDCISPTTHHDQRLERFNIGNRGKDHASPDELGVVTALDLDVADRAYMMSRLLCSSENGCRI